jgi:uncharacterized phiE125 gp8 family phage protein
MRGTYKISTPPATEPITLAEARAHLNFTADDPTDDDTLIEALIGAARETCEEYRNCAMLEQVITHVLPAFPCVDAVRNPFGEIRLYRPPHISVETIQYWDENNETQSLTPATDTNFNAVLGTISPKVGETWPKTASRPDAVTITYKCGHANAAAVPKRWKQAVLLVVGKWYEQREDNVKNLPTAAEHLLGVVREH